MSKSMNEMQKILLERHKQKLAEDNTETIRNSIEHNGMTALDNNKKSHDAYSKSEDKYFSNRFRPRR